MHLIKLIIFLSFLSLLDAQAQDKVLSERIFAKEYIRFVKKHETKKSFWRQTKLRKNFASSVLAAAPDYCSGRDSVILIMFEMEPYYWELHASDGVNFSNYGLLFTSNYKIESCTTIQNDILAPIAKEYWYSFNLSKLLEQTKKVNYCLNAQMIISKINWVGDECEIKFIWYNPPGWIR